MNLVELLIFMMLIGVGIACGWLLAQLLGIIGWIVGIPLGFGVSFWALGTLVKKLLEKHEGRRK